MTLQELSEACFRCPDSSMPATVYVFDDEEDAENWVDGKYSDANIAFVIRSDYKTCVWLKDRYANAKVVFFHCVRKDVLAVVIDLSRQEKKDDVD